MTFETFLEIVERITKSSTSFCSEYWSVYGTLALKDGNHVIFNSVHIGGMSGGNCWDNSGPEPYAITATDSMNLNKWPEFDSILTTICPGLTFVQFRHLSELEETDSFSEYEYYGNSSNYHVRYYKLRDVYDFLVTNNLSFGENYEKNDEDQ